MLLKILIVCIIGLVVMSAFVAAVVYHMVANPLVEMYLIIVEERTIQ